LIRSKRNIKIVQKATLADRLKEIPPPSMKMSQSLTFKLEKWQIPLSHTMRRSRGRSRSSRGFANRKKWYRLKSYMT